MSIKIIIGNNGRYKKYDREEHKKILSPKILISLMVEPDTSNIVM